MSLESCFVKSLSQFAQDWNGRRWLESDQHFTGQKSSQRAIRRGAQPARPLLLSLTRAERYAEYSGARSFGFSFESVRAPVRSSAGRGFALRQAPASRRSAKASDNVLFLSAVILPCVV